MIRFILSIVLLLSTAGNIFAADKAVVFKCLNKNRYEVYLNLQDDYRADSSMLGSISRQLLRGFFSIDRIPDKYYSVEKIDNISYFGFDITQYTVIPKDKDRFRQILWLDNSERIVKLEVYDNVNTFMFAFSGFDYMNGAMHSRHHKGMGHGMGKGMKRGTVGGGLGEEREGPNGYRGNVADKFKFWDTPEFYHGFRHFHTTVFNRNVFDLSFEDGINRFSVFIKPADRQIEPVSTIVYGNYLFSRIIDDVEYTVYGTVSFGFMEDIINKGNPWARKGTAACTWAFMRAEVKPKIIPQAAKAAIGIRRLRPRDEKKSMILFLLIFVVPLHVFKYSQILFHRGAPADFPFGAECFLSKEALYMMRLADFPFERPVSYIPYAGCGKLTSAPATFPYWPQSKRPAPFLPSWRH